MKPNNLPTRKTLQKVLLSRLKQIALAEMERLYPRGCFLPLPELPKFVYELAHRNEYDAITSWWRERVHECLTITALYNLPIDAPLTLDAQGHWIFPNGITFNEDCATLLQL